MDTYIGLEAHASSCMLGVVGVIEVDLALAVAHRWAPGVAKGRLLVRGCAHADPTINEFIVVEHTAQTGARLNGPLRTATAEVEFAKVEITPWAACVGLGESETFTAATPGIEDATVLWERESGPGSLSATTGSSVQYLAPADAGGTATLRAYQEKEPEVADRVTMTVGGCECWWAVQVTGIPSFGDATMDADWAVSYSASSTDLFSIGGNGTTSDGLIGSFGLGSGTGVPFAAGSHEMQVQGSYGSASSLLSFFTGEDLAFSTRLLSRPGLTGSRDPQPGRWSSGREPPATERVGSFEAAFRISPEATSDQGGPTMYICDSQ